MSLSRMKVAQHRAFWQPCLAQLHSNSHCRARRLHVVFCRSYATAHDDRVTPSTLLSSALDRKRRTSQRDDYVGPFQLGLIPPTPRDGGNVKKWSELSTAGKVARTTARTSNVAVILVGAGLSVMLVYALTSELFSKNSATVLYGQACKKIKASPQLASYLGEPLVFHNNPPSSVRPRHRNHHVSSQLVVDSYGREHMLLHFYVKGRPPGSSAPPSESESTSYVDTAMNWTKETASHVSEMSFEEMLETAKARVEAGVDAAKQLFKFLNGDSVPKSQAPEPVKQEVKVEEKKGWSSGFTGLFSGLRGTARSPAESRGDTTDGKVYSEGEVHADLVMNKNGYFEFRYLLVDIPNSHSWSTRRIFIERADGVRENEPIMSWQS